MERRKRSRSEPVDSLNSRAKRAAAAVLAGRTYLDVTRELGVPKQHVFYYVKEEVEGHGHGGCADVELPQRWQPQYWQLLFAAWSGGTREDAAAYMLRAAAQLRHVVRLQAP